MQVKLGDAIRMNAGVVAEVVSVSLGDRTMIVRYDHSGQASTWLPMECALEVLPKPQPQEA